MALLDFAVNNSPDAQGEPMTATEIQASIERLPWFHTIGLGQGVVTPGKWPPSRIILEAFDAVNFRGARVLDIGCLDGLWSFTAEERGAGEVYATDDVTQLGFTPAPTLETARAIRRSHVTYLSDVSVFDVAERFRGETFDVVIFTGVYYHLKDPLKALATLRQVLRPGGALIIEGPAILERERSYAQFYYHDVLDADASNWWVPTLRCLREWVECSFFEVKTEHVAVHRRPGRGRWFGAWRDRSEMRRVALTAVAVERADPLYKCPDAQLRAFDRNSYPAR
jgi:tRNA (mo5U34)-methyltransferase